VQLFFETLHVCTIVRHCPAPNPLAFALLF
jgi:hypothetical protein